MLALGARGREFDSLKSPDGGGGVVGVGWWCGVVCMRGYCTSFILCLCSSVVRAVGC